MDYLRAYYNYLKGNWSMASELKLSALDFQLLDLLQKDARRTNKDLAAEVGVAQSTCLEHIRRLCESGVIRGWHADVDPVALGRPIRALIKVRLQPKTTQSVREFQQELMRVPETMVISTVSGPDDFIVEICAGDVNGVRDFVFEHVTSRTDVVDAQSSLIFEQVRRPFIEVS
jgi:DNA-binding Lrp family transcriptional regulator